ncbi:MAG: arylsulfatase [Gemmataceae bacterium]
MPTVPHTLSLVAAVIVAGPLMAAPNVIILLTDDNGYGDLGCHGHPFLKTPNLDRLHDQSVRLTDFHVAPMCTPTRGQLLTGMDALRNGASSVSAGQTAIRRGIPTLADAFAAGGYRCGHFGKWHLGDAAPHLPQHRGFHEAVYHLGWGITALSDTWENDLFDGRFFHNGVLRRYPGYCTDVFFDEAMAWMQKCQAEGKPFLCYIAPNAPHTPHWVPAKYKEPYMGQPAPAFFGMMANIDENVGRLDAFLKARGLIDDTIVLYMNDNGATAGQPVYNAGMRAGKATYYEGGHRAAFFLRWPNGKLPRSYALDTLAEVQDVMPTLLDFCGVPTPANARFDGISLARPLRGQVAGLTDRMLVVQYGDQPGANGRKLEKYHCCVMWRKWRLVEGTELYELTDDPGQAVNVASKHPDVVKRLRDHYETWWTGIAPGVHDIEPVSVGRTDANPATLTSADWARVECDDAYQLRAGHRANGVWHLLVEREGEYEIELRRWPQGANAALAGGVPAFQARDGQLPAGKALPVAKVRLKLAGFDATTPVTATDKGATFTTTLQAGRTTMQSWLLDAAGEELAGAYFAYVRRK